VTILGADNSSTRRTFLKRAAALTAAGVHSRGQVKAAPSDRIRVGFIGLGAQGTGRLGEFMRHPDVFAAAVCDVDQTHLDGASALVQKTQNHKPDAYRDFRKVLERNDIDAVMIATPDHWHALPAVMACQAGKDVFVEKPMAYSIGEGRAMAAAATRNQRVTQLGNHIHNDLPNYRRAVEIVRSGMLGTINRVYCGLSGGGLSLPAAVDSAPPATLDYDFWLGPAPKRSYNPNRSHRSYRYFWDYSGGVFIDFWCHYADLAYWALDLKAPLAVSAAGGRWLAKDNAETPDVLEVLYEYPNNLVLTWTLHPRGRPGYEHMGSCVIFEGSDATLVANYSRHELWVKGKREENFTPPPRSIPDSPGHIREFLDSIKSRQPTTCNLEYGYRLTKGGLLGNIAFRSGERIQWDDAAGRVTNNNRANQFVTRKYRKPWKLG
jgi:predicted dehydrogenase